LIGEEEDDDDKLFEQIQSKAKALSRKFNGTYFDPKQEGK